MSALVRCGYRARRLVRFRIEQGQADTMRQKAKWRLRKVSGSKDMTGTAGSSRAIFRYRDRKDCCCVVPVRLSGVLLLVPEEDRRGRAEPGRGAERKD